MSSDKHTDVTRGMKGKIDVIKNITKLGIDTILVNGNKHGRLYNILLSKDVKCTVIRRGR
jgi:isopentenyl phosphate kinase